MKKTTWCPLPWLHIGVRNNGDLRLCCHSNTAPGKGIYLKDDGVTAYRADDPGAIEAARNSQLAKDVRKTMMSGEWHPSCIRCQREDEANLNSRRQYETELWAPALTEDQCATITDTDGTLDVSKSPLRYIDLRLGNLCNLKCRMCGPTDSSMWYDDLPEQADGSKQFNDSHGAVQLIRNNKGGWIAANNDYDWPQNQQFWDDFKKNISALRFIYVVGGEPFMIKEHFEFLEYLISEGVSEKIVLEYNTNGVVIPARAADIWAKFKRVRIGVSLDGVGEINDYVRYPAKWTHIKKNLHRLDDTPDNIEVWSSLTVQIYNIYYLDQILDEWIVMNTQEFKKINGLKRKKPITTSHALHGPINFNIRTLPSEIKNAIKNKFDDAASSFDDRHPGIDPRYKTAYVETLDSYIKFMMADDAYSPENFASFWAQTCDLDKKRNQNFSNTFPEFYDIICPYLKDK